MSCSEAPGSAFINFYSIWRGNGEKGGAKAWPCCVLQLSDSVIDRMKEPSSPSERQQRGSGAGLLLLFSSSCEKRDQMCPSELPNELIALLLRWFFFDINFSAHL